MTLHKTVLTSLAVPSYICRQVHATLFSYLHASALVELALEGVHQLGELALVLVLDCGQGQGSCVLLVHNGAQTGLAL